jgi:hypothetical protein
MRSLADIFVLSVLAIPCFAQQIVNTNLDGLNSLKAKKAFYELSALPPEYRAAALSAVIGEANEAAQSLGLPEAIPIVRSNIVSYYISPPALAKGMKAIGNITTSNYIYYVSVDNKLSFIEVHAGSSQEEPNGHTAMKYARPLSSLDTNAAYHLATAWLSKLPADVEALNRDCRLAIREWRPHGEQGLDFIPLYWVIWTKQNRPVAMVELFEPTRSLRRLRVEESKYILRKPVIVSP